MVMPWASLTGLLGLLQAAETPMGISWWGKPCVLSVCLGSCCCLGNEQHWALCKHLEAGGEAAEGPGHHTARPQMCPCRIADVQCMIYCPVQADAASKALTSSQAAVEAAAEQLAGSEAEERFKLWAAVQQQSEAAEVLQWNVSHFAMAKTAAT